MASIDWSTEITRAALPQAVLALLSAGPQHGYALVEVLRGSGFPRVQGGTLYPLLRRLEGQGLVEHRWEHDKTGPGRKVFELTPLGVNELGRAHAAWDHMSQMLATLRTN
ncbi:PadR family transcriptional regulator [Micrococcus sp. TA1]|jgi:PadR family transcriptional regulator PadR|uniref:PadR family transcriptional regulator n=1 Tax=Micrococcus sp. TA1 TaxID=681627 RepID=UPI00161C3E5F|nr:PadR family transcriptional regulator [Micrococcus sp. TA1]MBB5748729.1 PadR family transcriptional regulator PadR [Micrococcus sp. TA1]